MRSIVERHLEVAFALTVTGAAMTPWPWLALLVAGAYFVALAVIADRRSEGDPMHETDT